MSFKENGRESKIKWMVLVKQKKKLSDSPQAAALDPCKLWHYKPLKLWQCIDQPLQEPDDVSSLLVTSRLAPGLKQAPRQPDRRENTLQPSPLNCLVPPL